MASRTLCPHSFSLRLAPTKPGMLSTREPLDAVHGDPLNPHPHEHWLHDTQTRTAWLASRTLCPYSLSLRPMPMKGCTSPRVPTTWGLMGSQVEVAREGLLGKQRHADMSGGEGAERI